jgi:hypothetical protein
MTWTEFQNLLRLARWGDISPARRRALLLKARRYLDDVLSHKQEFK